ncbi:MAG TPA: carbon-nitrogen hydrolase family protein [Lacipirellulaceae bacterium]|jgi:predicted amidohydrolase|nr:carbon-nitrogen hydrolase family protein [Lacipirellulaceae bacterium]
MWRYVVFGLALTLGVHANSEFTYATEAKAAESQPAAQLRVAAVQMRSSSDLDANIRKIDEYLKRCAEDGVKVVVFPECALTGYFDDAYMKSFSAEQLENAEKQLAKACREHRVYAIVGTPHRDGNRLFNSAFVITPKGDILARYHKVQLAESWPAAGDELIVFKIAGVPASIIICHDERYPELVRLPVLAGARVIFYVSHESGLAHESKIVPYRAQIQARAVENTVYIVQANAPANADATGSHGQSRLIAPDGNIIEEASIFDEEVVAATLDLERATGRQAQQSVQRGPLGDWWRAGVARVRVIGD